MVISLSKALMIPSVAVPASVPKGLPMATARSPTERDCSAAIVTGERFDAFILITAISHVSSEATRDAE